MITVKILGGFGNQLRAFAFGYMVASMRNDELLLDISDYMAASK